MTLGTIVDEGLVTRFTSMVERVGGRVSRVASSDLEPTLARILEENEVHSLALSDSPWLRSVQAHLPAEIQIAVDPGDAELLEMDCGASTAQWGIAETGTLVLVSNEERHRRVSLLPPGHLAVLPTTRLVADLDEALAVCYRDEPPPTVTFVTGPSRTADIELTLVVGVHGPRWLQVVLVDPPDRSSQEA